MNLKNEPLTPSPRSIRRWAIAASLFLEFLNRNNALFRDGEKLTDRYRHFVERTLKSVIDAI